MRVVLAGLGSIGRRHLGNIRALVPDAEITILRHADRGEPLPLGADRVVYALADAVASRPDVALVCGPTTGHAEVAIALARAGAHLFVEKPLAATADDALAIVEAAASAGRNLIVGYNLRFLPSLRAMRAAVGDGSIGRPMSLRAEVGQYLPDWRPGSDYRETNSARAFGGGIVLELSHEIDYARWLLGEITTVDAVVDRQSDLEIDVDDTAELIVRFASGALGSIHLDMTQRSVVRTCRVAGTLGTLVWDGIADTVRRFRPEIGWEQLYEPSGNDRNAMYVDEVAHVLACVRGEATPLVSGRDGERVVAVAEAARRASALGMRIAL